MLKRLWLDNPLARAMMFHPRKVRPNTSQFANVLDGHITADDGVKIGYRWYKHPNPKAVLLFFHGNGETAADCEYAVPFFHGIDVSFIVADYRGYGWSDDEPRGSKLLPDAEALFSALMAMLVEDGISDKPLFIHGRSLGGAPSIHLTALFPEHITGLILESTFAHAPLLLSTMGLPKGLLRVVPPLFASGRKMKTITSTPLLIFHGEVDEVIPVEHGQMLFDAALTPHKQLIRIPNVGHNNLLNISHDQYFEAIQEFINTNL